MKASLVFVLHALFLLVVCNSLSAGDFKLDPLSDEFINHINSKQTMWKAGRNFPKNTSLLFLRRLTCVLPDFYKYKLPVFYHEIEVNEVIPTNFDSRTNWPHCPTIKEIRDQGSCGSCWALATVGAMSDRQCIHSNGTQSFHYSAQDLVSCCSTCGYGCNGGFPAMAFDYWVHEGIVSGGNYNSNQGCYPYEFEPCSHNWDISSVYPPCMGFQNTPKCKATCQKTYNISYEKDKRYGKNSYSLEGEKQIQKEIMTHGPVVGNFSMYEDFLYYKSGIYKHVAGGTVDPHVIRILGWGVENDTPYWLVANSFNDEWGDNGYFKILRGSNECGIENVAWAGIPRL